VVAALAALLTDIKTIVTAWDDLFMPRLQSHDINMRDLVVIATHRADLYVLKNRQDVERFVGRTLPPAETGTWRSLNLSSRRRATHLGRTAWPKHSPSHCGMDILTQFHRKTGLPGRARMVRLISAT
jgi:hypothetical protein